MVAFASRLAKERPQQMALRDAQRALPWSELGDHLNRCANALLHMELGSERRVAVFAENSVETVMAHMGSLIGGASSVPVNFHLTADEAAYILRDSSAEILFVGPETLDVGLEAARQANVNTVIGWRCRGAKHKAWEEFLGAASADEPLLDHPPRPNLIYTSGTTGRPKGTDLPPTMFAQGATVAEHLENVAAGMFAKFGVHGVFGPLYHTGPLSGSRSLVGGVPVVIAQRFNAEEMLRMIQDYRVETAVLVPTHFIRLLALPQKIRAQYDVSSLKFVFHTGASCPVEVKQAMLDWWGPVLWEAYGASEVGTTCSIGPQDWLAHPGSIGRAQPPFEALVVDEEGNELPPNQEGRLYFRDSTGRGVVYHNNPSASAEVHLRPGVFTLGEIGYIDEENFVYITDRFSDMIVSGGVNIFPAESEKELFAYPGIADVACIGVPNAEMGEELKALIVPMDAENPPDKAEIIAWVRTRIATYKCPRSVDFVTDLGRSAMGKINKRKLRAPFWAKKN